MFEARKASPEEEAAFWKTGKAPKGVWIPSDVTAGRNPDGSWIVTKRSADLVCPLCSRWASLMDHEIAADGTVSPSVGCPYEPCPFHENPVRLLGWSP